MPSRAVVCLVALAACGPAAQQLSVQAPAPQSALQCVEESAARLGYEVHPSGPPDGLRLERQLAISDPTRFPHHVRWYRIEAKLQDQGRTLDLNAGAFLRYADRHLMGRLVVPGPALKGDLAQIQLRCIPEAAAD